MALPQVKLGDVYTLELTDGIGLLQCVKEAEKTELEVIRILPGSYKQITTII